jgi:hypothetical protein
VPWHSRRDVKSHGRKIAARLIFDFLLLSFLATSIAVAQPGGTFTPTGQMTTPRFGHAATLLADGRVLIAGGRMIVGKGPNIGLGLSMMSLASAEIYDPNTGVFTRTGDMGAPRDSPEATLLPDGRVLISGGSGAPVSEIYDPKTGTFSPTTSAGSGSATLLNDGTVLMIEGRSSRQYNPVTDTSTTSGERTADFADTATLLSNGQVLIYGDGIGPSPFFAELFDPSTRTFTRTGSPSINHTGPSATLLTNGKVLLAGGDWGDGDGATAVAELYDPATGTFATTGSLIVGREQGTATLMRDGTVLFAGGHLAPRDVALAELYDPVTGTFALTGNMITGRELHSATLLKDGRVLIAGGDDERYWVPETILASAELYCPATANCPPDPWEGAISRMQAAAGTDDLNFWQWAWFWQSTPTFNGAPSGFGASGSISPELMARITSLGGGDPLQNVSAEQWVSDLRQASGCPGCWDY